MRYEKPELVVLGTADVVILGGEIGFPENLASNPRPELIGYDE